VKFLHCIFLGVEVEPFTIFRNIFLQSSSRNSVSSGWQRLFVPSFGVRAAGNVTCFAGHCSYHLIPARSFDISEGSGGVTAADALPGNALLPMN
jgi:hypothetical protein